MDGMNVFSEVNFAGQTISYGQAWAGMTYPDSVQLGPVAPVISYSVTPPCNAFISNGMPFNIYLWYKQNFTTMPTSNNFHYFNDSGECTEYDAWKMAFGMVFLGGRAYFVGSTSSNYNFSQIAVRMQSAGYMGADLNNITNYDIEMASLYIYKATNSYLPDITNLSANSGGQPLYDMTNKIVSAMSYELYNYYLGGYSTVPEMVMAEPVNMYTSYDPLIYYYGPDPTTTIWAYARPVSGGNYAFKDWTDGLPLFMLTDLNNYTDDVAAPGGGYGDYNYYSDSIGFSELPTIGVEDTGFTVMYAPTLAEVKNLATYMWTDSFIQNLKKLISTDPIKGIIQFGFIPLDLTSVRGNTQSVVIGNVDTGVQMHKLTEQYISVDMGSISLSPRWQTALSWEPYTIVEAYLPFIGFIQLPTSEIFRPESEGVSKIYLNYNVNLFTGEFVAELKTTIRGVKTVLFSHTGTMMYQVPLTGADYGQFYKNILGAASRVIPSFLGGPALGVASTVTSALSAATTPMQVQRSGTISGGSAIMGQFGAYLVIRTPVQHFDSAAHAELVGYPSYLFRQLSELSGFTVCDSVNMDGFTGTAEEAAEIETLLKGGVYL